MYGKIALFFRKSPSNENDVPIKVEAYQDEKVRDIILKYRINTGDQDLTKKFIFDAENLNPQLTVAEAGLRDNSNIFVVSTRPIYSQQNLNSSNINKYNNQNSQLINGKIALIFRIKLFNDYVPIMVEAYQNEKVNDIILKYRLKSGDQDLTKNFIYKAKSLNPQLTVAEAWLEDNSNIFVVSIRPIYSQQNLDSSNINNYNNQNSQLNNEILNFKNELNNKNQIIQQLQSTINNLKNKYYNLKNNAQNLAKNLEEKERELISLKNELLNTKNELINTKNEIIKLNNNMDNSNLQNNKGVKNFAINFLSIDSQINYPIACNSNSVISRLEEELYNEYPAYKDYNTFLTVNGIVIKRFKSIKENGIKKGDQILVNIYE